MELKYYSVEAICGHVRRSNYIIIKFAVKAESGKEAAKKARQLPRVKHDRKDAIKTVEEISHEEYLELLKANREDSYLKCGSRQEQNILCKNINERILKHTVRENDYDRKRKERIEFMKKKKKIDKKIESYLKKEANFYMEAMGI